jgi:hypothetical protein
MDGCILIMIFESGSNLMKSNLNYVADTIHRGGTTARLGSLKLNLEVIPKAIVKLRSVHIMLY